MLIIFFFFSLVICWNLSRFTLVSQPIGRKMVSTTVWCLTKLVWGTWPTHHHCMLILWKLLSKMEKNRLNTKKKKFILVSSWHFFPEDSNRLKKLLSYEPVYMWHIRALKNSSSFLLFIKKKEYTDQNLHNEPWNLILFSHLMGILVILGVHNWIWVGILLGIDLLAADTYMVHCSLFYKWSCIQTSQPPYDQLISQFLDFFCKCAFISNTNDIDNGIIFIIIVIIMLSKYK